MSNFSLSEDEYCRIDAVRGQLGLICGLLGASGVDSNHFDASDLYDFLAAQIDTIKGVITAVDARYAIQKEEGQLNWIHWSHALKIASGDSIHTPHGAEQFVSEGLMKASRIDDGMKHALETWFEVLDRQKAVTAHTATAKTPASRKRDKLIPKEGRAIA